MTGDVVPWRRAVRIGLAVVVAVGLAGCSGEPSAVERARAGLEVARGYEAAWDGESIDAIGVFLSDEEFGYTEPPQSDVPKAQFLALMSGFLGSVGQVGQRFFADGEEVLVVSLAYGFGGATRESPMTDVELFAFGDGAITSITEMYGPDLLVHFGLSGPTSTIDAYREAWASGDPAAVAGLYAEEAVRRDALFGVELAGRTEIADPGGAGDTGPAWGDLALVEPFVFGNGGGYAPTQSGAVFDLTDQAGCLMQVAVLFEGEPPAISSDRVFYDLTTLEECGWLS